MAFMSSVCFAQGVCREQKGKQAQTPVAAFKAQLKKQAAKASVKAVGDTISSFPWTQGFENGTTGFTFVDNNNDGFNWEIMTASGDNFNVHDGDACIVSASYDSDNEIALTPDNWMILPAMQIPSTGTDFNLTWFERGQDANYADEYYSVYITTTGHAVSNFTATTAVYSGYSTGSWVKKTVSLSSYAGQTIHIAFRHHNVTDMFYLNIDDIRIGGPELPTVSLSGPTTIPTNHSATYTAVSEATSFQWYINGTAWTSTTSETLTTSFATPGTYQIAVVVTNNAGSASDTLDVNVIECNAVSGTYFEDFEDMDPCWQFVSADPANDNRVGVDNTYAYSGTNSFRFSSFASASDYNQFLITPELDLTGNYMVGFWYKGYNSGDAFRVKVSTTTTDTAAFTTVLGDYPTVNTDWTYVAFQLPSNAKYVAINYYGNYAYYLYIDDFTIDEMGAPIVTLEGDVSVGTGMVANYIASASLANSFNWYVDGSLQNSTGNTFSHIFTTTGLHQVVASASNTYGTSFDTLTVDVFSCDGITIPYTPDFSDGLGCWVNRSDESESGWFASVDMFDEDPIGQVLSMSGQSYYGMFIVDIPADNWLISPVIEMPVSGGSYEIAYEVAPYMADYDGDHYGVYVISGTDTTLLFEESLTGMEEFTPRAVAIPSTINGNFRVAFRHFNSEGGYVIILDNIELRSLTAPSVSIVGPTSVMSGTQVTYTAVSGTATSFSWSVDGSAVSETSNILTQVFTTGGTHTVAVTASNNAGSANASLTVDVISCDAITSFPWTADFEDEDADYSCWNIIDADGDGYCWQLLNGQYDDGTGYGHNSNTTISSASYINNVGALNPDNYLVLPAMALPQGGNATLSWFDKGQDASYADEYYSVYVSTTGNNASDFTNELYSGYSTGEWENHSVSLSAFAGQTIYIAFRHYNVTDMFYLDIDDITVSANGGGVGIADVENSNVSIYPNPASDMVKVSLEGVDGKVNVQIVDINGRTVKEQNGNAQGMNIEVSSLSRGTYYVRMTGENVNVVRKLVLK